MEYQTDRSSSVLPFEDHIDLRQYIILLRQWAWLIILSAILAGVAAFVVSRRMTPIYKATTRVLVKEAPSTRTSDYAALLTSERLAKTYSEMITARPILEQVLHNLGLADMEVRDLRKAISVKQITDTQLIEIAVEDTSPERAAAIVNEIVRVFEAHIQDLEHQSYTDAKNRILEQMNAVQANVQSLQNELAALSPDDQERKAQLEEALRQASQTYANLVSTYETLSIQEVQSATNVNQVDPAVPPENPVRPRTLLNTLLAMIVGAMLAVGAVFLIQALDDSIRTPEEVTTAFRLPVIGFVPELYSNHRNGSSPIVRPRAPEAEAYRTLRANLEFISPDKPLHVLMISSPSPGEGKSLTAVNLAIIIAQTGKRVILVDTDFRKPTVHKKLGLTNRQGLSTAFRGVPVEAVLKRITDNLHVLTTGHLPPNPSELLGSRKMREILQILRGRSDFVLLDAPPGFVSDTSYLATAVDGVLLVVKPGETSRDATAQMLTQLRRVGANVVGIVFNQVSRRHSYYYPYYHYNYKYYQEKTE